MDAALQFGMDHGLAIAGWVIILGALIVVPFRRSVAEARSWLLVFFAIPPVALLLYFIIGRPEHSAVRKARFAKLPAIITRSLGWRDVPERVAEADEQAMALTDKQIDSSKLAHALAGMPLLPGNKLELLPDYDGSIDRMITDIDAATGHVHLEFYIFAADATGRKVMDALVRAKGRGVTCRVLVDAMGSFTSAHLVERRMKKAGIAIHRILPLARRWNSSRIDLRNHRKIAVIDGRIGYTGSQNIINAADGKASSGSGSSMANKELVVRCEGPIVSALQAVFVADWFLETEVELAGESLYAAEEHVGDIPAQLLPSGPDFQKGGIDLYFTNAIYDANDAVVITTPYFIPNDALIAAMKTAILRGVSVTLIVPMRTDSKLVTLAQRSYFANLLEAGVDILIYDKGFLHAKHMRIDHCLAIIGSSNMDQRSFELNAEVSLIAYNEPAARALETVEQAYARDGHYLDADAWLKRPIYVKVLENCARMMSDLL